ncbi:copper resistance D family protein [Acinetobacter dispersus]|uniref:copper resistance D family protein n=1 Tax=Acinetobacter dispersus TaxID=70348 RepID=UPI00132E9BAD|nr:CopD family protein [Acinetobacter dispersus]QHH96438.1 copper resistance protein CopD [Acinetobacter dispersus]
MSEYWMFAAWFNKVSLYLGMIMVIGGSFCYFLLDRYTAIKRTIVQYMTLGAVLGLISSTLAFLLLIGSFANTGLFGMFDLTYINIVLNTSTGHIHLIRIVSFALILTLLFVKLHQKSTSIRSFEKIFFAIPLVLIVYSFSQLGHVTNLSIFAQFLLTIHVLVMSVWMGSLYPLWKTSHSISGLPLKQAMHLFGRIAAFIVAVLIACGASIALLLFKDFNTLIATPYGQGFIIKLLLVICILLLAAFNKWYFTPRLQQPQFAKQLGYAILFEMSLGFLILMVTAYITTVVGID